MVTIAGLMWILYSAPAGATVLCSVCVDNSLIQSEINNRLHTFIGRWCRSVAILSEQIIGLRLDLYIWVSCHVIVLRFPPFVYFITSGMKSHLLAVIRISDPRQ